MSPPGAPPRRPIRVLHLEDDPNDAELTRGTLEFGGLECQECRAHNRDDFLAHLRSGEEFDLILADYSLPGIDGHEALALARDARPDVPFIVISGKIGEDAAIDMLHAGATDYVLKQRMSRLFPAVERALRERARERAHGEATRLVRQLSERLHESGILEAVLTQMPAGVLVAEAPSGRVLLLNKQFCALLGCPREQLRSLQDLAGCPGCILDAGSFQFHELAPLQVLRTGAVVAGELVDWSVAGERRVVLANAAPVRDADGHVLAVVSTVTDVTARILAEEERAKLLEQVTKDRALLRTVLEQMPAGVVIAEAPSGKILMANAQAAAVLETGLAEGTVMGLDRQPAWRKDGSRYHAGERPLVQSIQHARVARDEEVQLDSGQGRRTLLVNAAPVRDPRGEVVAGVSAFVDISDRKRMEAELRDSEERFHTLADNITQLAWMADEKGEVTWYNKRWLDYTGLTLEQMQGWGWQQVHHPEHLQRVVEKLRRCFETGETWEDTFPLRGADGRYRWFLSRAVPVRDQAGKVVRWFGTSTDITEQRDAQEALRQADQHKSDFLAVLSHELRNPLAPIRNSVYILEHAAPGGDQAHRARAVIDRQVRLMTRLIDDLLDITRITRGKLRLHREPVELNDLVRRAAEDHRELFVRNGIELRVTTCPQPLPAHADAARVSQVLGNLLHNALKFTPRGGRATLSLEAARGPEAVIRVQDTGLGIPREVLDRLFEPFVQSDQTLDRSQGGLGLGLALVKGFVELHGGTVDASSAGPGTGAEFTVRLPLAPAPSTHLEVPTSHPAARPHRVLIIEDNIDAADSLREALELNGHSVQVAVAGPEAIARARHEPPDVILCDIGLPGMDGYEVARTLRADPGTRPIYLVALSGYALPEDVEKAREAGFDRHLAKPPDLGELEQLVAEAGRSAAG